MLGKPDALYFTDTTIVFDLDGTIVDTAPDLTAATNHALGLAGLAPVTVAELHPFIGHGSKAMIEAGLGFRGAASPRTRRGGRTRPSSPSTRPTSPSAAAPTLACRSCSTGSLAGGARLGGLHQQVRRPLQGAAGGAGPRSALRRHRRSRHVRRLQAGCRGTSRAPSRWPAAGVERAVMVGDSATDFATAQGRQACRRSG